MTPKASTLRTIGSYCTVISGLSAFFGLIQGVADHYTPSLAVPGVLMAIGLGCKLWGHAKDDWTIPLSVRSKVILGGEFALAAIATGQGFSHHPIGHGGDLLVAAGLTAIGVTGLLRKNYDGITA